MDSHCSYLERSLLWRISRTATLRLYKKNLVLRSGAALDSYSYMWYMYLNYNKFNVDGMAT